MADEEVKEVKEKKKGIGGLLMSIIVPAIVAVGAEKKLPS
jgi:flagellar FliL protein